MRRCGHEEEEKRTEGGTDFHCKGERVKELRGKGIVEREHSFSVSDIIRSDKYEMNYIIRCALSSLNLLGEKNVGKLPRYYDKFVKCNRAIVSFVALCNDCLSLAGYFGFCFGTMIGS